MAVPPRKYRKCICFCSKRKAYISLHNGTTVFGVYIISRSSLPLLMPMCVYVVHIMHWISSHAARFACTMHRLLGHCVFLSACERMWRWLGVRASRIWFAYFLAHKIHARPFARSTRYKATAEQKQQQRQSKKKNISKQQTHLHTPQPQTLEH